MERDSSMFFYRVVTRLQNLCNEVLLEKISGHQLQYLLNEIGHEEKERLANCITEKLSTSLALSLFSNEIYWQRKCHDKNLTCVDYWLHFCNWRSTYVSHEAEEFIDEFICGKISFSELEAILLNYKDYLFTLKINAFKLKYFNEDFQEFTVKNDKPLEHYILKLILMFPFLKEIYLNNIPINYDLVFDLEGNSFADHSIRIFSQSLSKIATLQKLSLISTCMQMSHFRDLMGAALKMNNLVDLNLSFNLISDAMCEIIAELLRNSKLERLTLSNNRIGDEGSKLIGSVLDQKIPLKCLFLDKNFIGDAGATYLTENLVANTCLQKLDISNNRIGAKTAAAVCALLKKNSVLDFLNLSGNYLGKEAGSEICAAVKCNKAIKCLSLQFCGFTEDDEDEINMHVSNNIINSQ